MKEKQPIITNRKAKLTEIAARWEWMCDLLDGKEVSDFALSFPEVRELNYLMKELRKHED